MIDVNRMGRDEVLSNTAEIVSSLEKEIDALKSQRHMILALGVVFIGLYIL